MADAAYHFLSFVRTGFSGALTQPDTLRSAQPAVATAPVSVAVSGVARPVSRTVTVRGPGDITGVSSSQVIRTDPIAGAAGVEPNYFAQVEFDRPDMPWMFTPAAPTGEKLRPWLVLVVLDAAGEHACRLLPGVPLPRVSVPTEAAAQLPDLGDSHLWAHAQVVTPGGLSVADAVRGDPRLSVSRLMCPRHLQPDTSYLAALVPAFAVGRLAGLGLPVTADDEARLDPAWLPGQAVDLPVYYSWEFRTGEDADFESLARKLEGRPLPAGVGTRALDVSRPGAGLPDAPPPDDVHDTRAIEWLDGALRPVNSDSLPPRDAGAVSAWETSLTVLLDRPADLVSAGDQDPVVAPPIYGDHHALVFKLAGTSPPPWLAELNLGARTRVAAGIGTQAVQQHQEDYVARAWRQLGDVLDANRLLRAAQLARTVGLRVHARLSTLDPATTLAVASPLHDRVVGAVTAGVSVTRAVTASRLPDITVRPAFRRLGRPGAAASRAAGVATIATQAVNRFAGEAFHAPVAGPDGATAMRDASDVVGSAEATALVVALGGTEGAGTADQVVSTLNAHQAAMPLATDLTALPRRGDVGAAAVVASLGAVPATAIAALMQVASGGAAPTPAAPPPAPARGPGGVLPHGLVGLAASDHSPAPPVHVPPVHVPPVHVPPVHLPPLQQGGVFVPGGPSHQLGGGAVLVGGTVTVDSDAVRAVSTGSLTVTAVDDARWASMVGVSGIPAVTAGADPVTDPGWRLSTIRDDAGSLTALASVASGDVRTTVQLDQLVNDRATTGAVAGTMIAGLLSGSFTPALPPPATGVRSAADVAATAELVAGAAAAIAAMVTADDAPIRPDGPPLDLAAARTGLLTHLDPAITVTARARARLTSLVRPGVPPRDNLDPVLACPIFQDPMWQAVRDLGNGWMLPGLELVPPDTATLVRTNPTFVSSFLVGTNHEMMRELLWREYPTDQRGTGFTRFWGRSGAHPDDIGPIHLFAGHLADTLLTGQKSEAVLLLRSELLRRYPGSLVYLSRARQVGGDLALDDDTIELPVFRGDLPPDVSFVGFPISPDDLRTAGDPWYFVIAQPPSEPRFGLDDPADDTPAVPTTASDLAWIHMAPDGNPATPARFAIGDPPALRGQALDGSLHWGDSAAVQAHLTYQHPVRVAIRAADLLPPDPGSTP